MAKKYTINLSQKTANRLMELYREMDLVPEKDFVQSDCEKCVLGHAMHHGIIKGCKPNGINAEDMFDDAVAWVGLPYVPELDGTMENFERFMPYEYGVLGDYLFGTNYGIWDAGRALGFIRNKTDMLPPSNYSFTPKDAQRRIVKVLKAADYEVVWDK